MNVKIQQTEQFRAVYFIVCKIIQKLKRDEEGRRDTERYRERRRRGGRKGGGNGRRREWQGSDKRSHANSEPKCAKFIKTDI